MPVYVIDTLKPKNGLDFAVVEAVDVAVEGYANLADAVTHFATQSALAELTAALSDKADTSDITNLQSQIDQIVISASAEAVVAPEVAAARVDADGTSYQTLKARLDSDAAFSKSVDEYLKAFIDTTVKKRYISLPPKDITNAVKYSGYYDTGAGIATNDSFSTWQFTSDVDFEFYTNRPNAYLSITVYSDAEMTSVVSARVRHFRDDPWTGFPDQSNPLSVKRGQCVSITVDKAYEDSDDHVIVYTTDITYGYALSDNIDFSAKMLDGLEEITDSIDELKNDIFTESSERTSISELEGVVAESGYYAVVAASNDARLMALSTFDSYYVFSDRECDIYPIPISGYQSIVHGQNASAPVVRPDGNISFTCSNPVRYRGSDGNLPTESNPIHVGVGDVLIFSADAGQTFDIYGYTPKTVINDEFIEQIEEGLPSVKNCKLEYISESGVDSSTERINVYVPAAVGYVRYRFVHSESQDRNADVWRIADAYAVDDYLSERYALTTAGEWECALHLPDRSDFSGGIAHGDEILSSVAFFVDGAEIEPDTIVGIKEFSEFKIIENSTLYDPDDSVTAIATHGSEHIFDKSGVTIKQRIMWQYSGSLTNCYLAMFPMAKAVSDTFYTDTNYAPISIGNQSHNIPDTYDVTLYKSDVGVSGNFEITDYPNLQYFFMTDNGTPNYNKCYYVINASSVESGTKWKAETKYSFEIGK